MKTTQINDNEGWKHIKRTSQTGQEKTRPDRTK